MSGLLSHLTQRIVAPELSLRPSLPGIFASRGDEPELEHAESTRERWGGVEQASKRAPASLAGLELSEQPPPQVRSPGRASVAADRARSAPALERSDAASGPEPVHERSGPARASSGSPESPFASPAAVPRLGADAEPKQAPPVLSEHRQVHDSAGDGDGASGTLAQRLTALECALHELPGRATPNAAMVGDAGVNRLAARPKAEAPAGSGPPASARERRGQQPQGPSAFGAASGLRVPAFGNEMSAKPKLASPLQSDVVRAVAAAGQPWPAHSEERPAMGSARSLDTSRAASTTAPAIPGTVHISIGRIDLRTAPVAPARRSARPQPHVSLASYLEKRHGGRG
jgi:hypothetical protein